ncbi:binding partner of ACD11 1 isoform X2 [Quercus suber]|uniref:binding partner of ACD11 1 isoform X2 n=1 Tax=Quercus suber TaxID=58331 RepID=UPI0032DF3F59
MLGNESFKITTVKVSNVSLGASEQDLKEFFSFSGKIEYVEMKSEDEKSQVAYVTFRETQGAETAVLLSGATIVDQSVHIALAPDYELPAAAASALATETEQKREGGSETAIQNAEDVVSSMLAKGFNLGKDALNKAKAFDEKHQFTSTATAKVVSLDQKIGLTEKVTAGTTIVTEKVKEMDEKFQVSEKTKTAISAAEQTVSNAGSAIMKNRYVLTGATWVTGAFSKVTKAAGEVGQKAKEKVIAEEDQEKKVEGSAQTHETESPKNEPSKTTPAQGLIL